MLQNAKRDGAEWAWIPSGDGCAMCMTIASRGWLPASSAQLSGGHATHIHANCKCQFAIRFDKNLSVEGYDPDELKRQYDAAEGSGTRQKINYLRRKQYEKIKDKLLLEAENPFKNPNTPLKIDRISQSKHIIGDNRYNNYIKTYEFPPSYLIISEEEVQKLVDKYHGTGILSLNSKGKLISSEMIVDNDIPIGYAVNNKNGEKVLTTGFKIHYSKNGTHIVPMYENQKQYWKERRSQNGHDWLLRQKN